MKRTNNVTVYALKGKWETGHLEQEGDYEIVYPTENWNYGLLDTAVASAATVTQVKTVKPITADFVWNIDHAPIEIATTAKQIPGWKVNEDGVAMQPVTDRTGIHKGEVSRKE